MRHLLLPVLLLLPLTAWSAECRFSAPRNLHENLTGIRGVQIELHYHDLHLAGAGNATALDLTGRACASSSDVLNDLLVSSHREGDQLIVEVGKDGHFFSELFGNSYAYLEVQMRLPSNLPVTVNSGSGDTYVSGLAQLDAQAGSGDLHIEHILGDVTVSVGSGDAEISDVGSLKAGSIGSGDLKVRNVNKDVRIGSVGSGDVTVDHVGGSVDLATLGSGDVSANDVRGDLIVGAKGSGEVRYSNIGGKVNVPRDDDDD